MKLQPRLIPLAVFGVCVLSFGVALNSCAGLGNDSIALFFDGIKHLLKLDPTQLGTASNIVNGILLVFLWFVGRHYVNIGTLIQIIPYGFVVNASTKLLLQWIRFDSLAIRATASFFGCLLLYVGVSIYIAVGIGIDPFTGVVMLISEKSGWPFRRTKILFDFALIVLGVLLGGTIGVVTIFTALTAGPCMQFFSQRFRPLIHREQRTTLSE